MTAQFSDASPNTSATPLVEPAKEGPGGDLDFTARSKLFTLGLIAVTSERRVVLVIGVPGREYFRGTPDDSFQVHDGPHFQSKLP